MCLLTVPPNKINSFPTFASIISLYFRAYKTVGIFLINEYLRKCNEDVFIHKSLANHENKSYLYVIAMTFLHKISLLLTPLMMVSIFVSSMSINIDFHYCQGQLKSFNILGKAKNCHELAVKKSACKHHAKKQHQDSKKIESTTNCCTNNSVFIDADSNDQYVDVITTKTNLKAIQSYPEIIDFSSDSNIKKSGVPYAYYKPPLKQKDFSVLYQCFLL